MIARRRLLTWLVAVTGMGIIVLVALYEPTHTARGLLQREAFFRHRPTSYWREALRADGAAGQVSCTTFDTFGELGAIAVLHECAVDRDADVRWAAVVLMQQVGSHADAIPVFGRALDDPDDGVRRAAIVGLGYRRREALPFLPKLVELTRDPELDIRVNAHWALWEIDEATAVKAGNWQEFHCEKWQFRVTMPGTPTEESNQMEAIGGPAPFETFSADFGPTYCAVNVTDYAPRELADSWEDLADTVAQGSAAATNGTLASDEPIEQDGHHGRETVITYGSGSTLHSRKFVVGNRLYQVIIGFPHGTLSPRAESFFLNSFHLDLPSE